MRIKLPFAILRSWLCSAVVLIFRGFSDLRMPVGRHIPGITGMASARRVASSGGLVGHSQKSEGGLLPLHASIMWSETDR
jgi:hypothetical protein